MSSPSTSGSGSASIMASVASGTGALGAGRGAGRVGAGPSSGCTCTLDNELRGKMISYLLIHFILEHIHIIRRNPSFRGCCSVVSSY